MNRTDSVKQKEASQQGQAFLPLLRAGRPVLQNRENPVNSFFRFEPPKERTLQRKEHSFHDLQRKPLSFPMAEHPGQAVQKFLDLPVFSAGRSHVDFHFKRSLPLKFTLTFHFRNFALAGFNASADFTLNHPHSPQITPAPAAIFPYLPRGDIFPASLIHHFLLSQPA